VVKNKLAAPFREVEFDIAYGHGVSATGELIDLGIEAGLLDKSGAWISMGGERLGNGRDAACQTLATRPELAARLRADLLARAGIAGRAGATAAPPTGAPGAPDAAAAPAVRARRAA
jgi:recombination protein RecA